MDAATTRWRPAAARLRWIAREPHAGGALLASRVARGAGGIAEIPGRVRKGEVMSPLAHLVVWIHTPFAQALGWTLVHFIWEGAVLAAVLMAGLRVLRADPAQRRYTLACLILAAM